MLLVVVVDDFVNNLLLVVVNQLGWIACAVKIFQLVSLCINIFAVLAINQNYYCDNFHSVLCQLKMILL